MADLSRRVIDSQQMSAPLGWGQKKSRLPILFRSFSLIGCQQQVHSSSSGYGTAMLLLNGPFLTCDRQASIISSI